MAELTVDIDHLKIDHLDVLLANQGHDVLCGFFHGAFLPCVRIDMHYYSATNGAASTENPYLQAKRLPETQQPDDAEGD